MPGEINWERTGYQSRVDALADEISTFVETVLQTVDMERVRKSPARWEKVCRFFAGCARAARAQGNTPLAGGKRIAEYLTEEFPCSLEGSDEGFFEFMDWLSRPNEFRPTRLRNSLQETSAS